MGILPYHIVSEEYNNMVNRYIGARYVPIFSTENNGQWTNTIAYEPLTIVLYQGGSYTSKQYVPVGAEITNSNYWVKTGDFNGQLVQLTNEVNALQDIVGTNTDDIMDLTNKTSRAVILITDSFGTKTYNNITTSFPDATKHYLHWPDGTFFSSAEDGAGFCNGNFLNQLNALIPTIPHPLEISDIYICGGWNDENGRPNVNAGTFMSAAQEFTNVAKQNFPNAKLHACFISYAYDMPNTAGPYKMSNLKQTLSWYRNLINIGWEYHNNTQYILHNRNFFGPISTDHPNQYGANYLATHIANVINTGYTNVTYETQTPITVVSTATNAPDILNTSNANYTLYETLHNDTITLKILGTYENMIGAWATPLAYTYDSHTIIPLLIPNPQLYRGEKLVNFGNTVELWGGESTTPEYICRATACMDSRGVWALPFYRPRSRQGDMQVTSPISNQPIVNLILGWCTQVCDSWD